MIHVCIQWNKSILLIIFHQPGFPWDHVGSQNDHYMGRHSKKSSPLSITKWSLPSKLALQLFWMNLITLRCCSCFPWWLNQHGLSFLRGKKKNGQKKTPRNPHRKKAVGRLVRKPHNSTAGYTPRRRRPQGSYQALMCKVPRHDTTTAPSLEVWGKVGTPHDGENQHDFLMDLIQRAMDAMYLWIFWLN